MGWGESLNSTILKSFLIFLKGFHLKFGYKLYTHNDKVVGGDLYLGGTIDDTFGVHTKEFTEHPSTLGTSEDEQFIEAVYPYMKVMSEALSNATQSVIDRAEGSPNG